MISLTELLKEFMLDQHDHETKQDSIVFTNLKGDAVAFTKVQDIAVIIGIYISVPDEPVKIPDFYVIKKDTTKQQLSAAIMAVWDVIVPF
jgi:hypothetical protein